MGVVMEDVVMEEVMMELVVAEEVVMELVVAEEVEEVLRARRGQPKVVVKAGAISSVPGAA